MICVGIDVAKDKHDCVILNSEGKILSVISHVLILRTRSSLMQVCHRLPINQDSFHWLEPTLTWRNAALAICVMRFTTRPSMSAIGTQALRLTLLKSELRESITTLHFLMPLRNWFG